MPIPKPRKNEKQKDFIARCHSELKDEYTDQKQRHAICMNAWRNKNKKKKSKGLKLAEEIKEKIDKLIQEWKDLEESLEG